MTLYVENPKHFMKKKKKLLELINPAKLQEYKISTANQLFLYTNNEQSKKEIKKTISFIIVSKRIKSLGINQGGKGLYMGRLQHTAERN